MNRRHELHFGRVLTCYAERATDIAAVLRAAAARTPDALAILDGERRLTHAQLAAAAARLAAGLAAAGVRPGDRVAVMLPNTAEAAIAVCGIAHAGAVLVPVGTRQRAPELAHVFADCTPAAVIAAPGFLPEVMASGAAPACVVAAPGPAWDAMLARPEAPPAPPPGEEAPYAILYTSGTTGRPKGAVLTHFNVAHTLLHWRAVFGLRPGERSVLVVPWSHVTGLCAVLLPMLELGGAVAMMAEFRRRDFLHLAAAIGMTHGVMVPAMYALLLLEPDLASFDLGAWRIGGYGGAPMPEATIRRFAEAFPNLLLCNAYGATETTSPTTIMPPGEGLRRADSVGRPAPCADIRVMDEAGRELPPGETGELWIAGPMVIPGYWNNPAADEAAFAGGYWRSGDLGSIDAEGYVRLVDRKKDMINRGGYKVYPAEVENELAGLAGVVEAAVVGRPDPILGETVVAFIATADPALDPARVRAWCAARMADYKVPGQVVLGADPLPRNANGKLQKAVLREAAAALPPPPRG